jgi:hypothetical protein
MESMGRRKAPGIRIGCSEASAAGTVDWVGPAFLGIPTVSANVHVSSLQSANVMLNNIWSGEEASP